MACLAAPTRLHAGDDLADLSIEELLEVPVATPSRAMEAMADAPATIVVITRDDIETRGYRELSQVLDDLPGLDVVRPYGDSWVLSYFEASLSHTLPPAQHPGRRVARGEQEHDPRRRAGTQPGQTQRRRPRALVPPAPERPTRRWPPAPRASPTWPTTSCTSGSPPSCPPG